MSAIIRENMEGGVLMIKETPPNMRNSNGKPIIRIVGERD